MLVTANQCEGLGCVGLGTTGGISTGKVAMTALASSLATAAAVTPPPANAILAAAAGIVAALNALGIGQGCGQTCIQATAIVNQAEPAFLANVQQYENGQISQAQAQQTWNNLWQAVQGSCAAIPGQAGQDCVSDRAEGSCKWKQTANGDTLGLPGVPAVGECWNWYNGYYVPLTYPAVNVAPTISGSADGIVAGVESVIGSSSILVIGGIVVVALIAMGSN